MDDSTRSIFKRLDALEHQMSDLLRDRGGVAHVQSASVAPGEGWRPPVAAAPPAVTLAVAIPLDRAPDAVKVSGKDRLEITSGEEKDVLDLPRYVSRDPLVCSFHRGVLEVVLEVEALS